MVKGQSLNANGKSRNQPVGSSSYMGNNDAHGFRLLGAYEALRDLLTRNFLFNLTAILFILREG